VPIGSPQGKYCLWGLLNFRRFSISIKELILLKKKEVFYEKYDFFYHFIDGFSMSSGQSTGALRAL
jgi:hypothetical protein